MRIFDLKYVFKAVFSLYFRVMSSGMNPSQRYLPCHRVKYTVPV